MIVRDFDKQRILSPAEVGAYVKRVPPKHLSGLQSILYKPQHELRSLHIDVDPGCKGAFYPEFRSIIIFDLVSRKLGPHILLHEIGHYVFHRYLDSFAKKEWVTKIWPKEQKITEYGKTSGVEDFAETYAIYLLDPSKLARCPRKAHFLKTKVF